MENGRKPRRLKPKPGEGVVWKLDFFAEDNDPAARKWISFVVTCINTDVSKTLKLRSEVGWWAEHIVAEIYKKLGGIGTVTVIPTKRFLTMFTDLQF